MDLRQAFETVLYDKKFYSSLNETEKGRIRNLRRYLKQGKVTLDKMEDWVKRYGFTLKQSEVWEVPK